MNIAVLVSGGVDSSVALALLKEQGHNVTAFYLKIWLEDELSSLGECPWETDLQYVRGVCEKLDVPLEIVPLQQEYWDHVVSYTIAEVKAGRTPNPDIFCNKLVKFGFFLDKIDRNRFDAVATGHYAQNYERDGLQYLKQAPDAVKDQTYFLSYLSQDQLKRSLFPIGHLQKSQVRELAHQFDLPTKDRKDSQGICFLGKFKFQDFIKHYLGVAQGDLVEIESGAILGHHQGFWYYTIGQRQGIGLAGGPWYVAAKDTQRNIVYVSRQYYDQDKVRDTFKVTNMNWFAGHMSQEHLLVKLRHGKNFYNCTVQQNADGSLTVKLDGQDQGIALGQFAVFYDGDVCLGGGVIS